MPAGSTGALANFSAAAAIGNALAFPGDLARRPEVRHVRRSHALESELARQETRARSRAGGDRSIVFSRRLSRRRYRGSEVGRPVDGSSRHRLPVLWVRFPTDGFARSL